MKPRKGNYLKVRGLPTAYVTVRVSSGFAVLDELYIGGMPVSDFLAKAVK